MTLTLYLHLLLMVVHTFCARCAHPVLFLACRQVAQKYRNASLVLQADAARKADEATAPAAAAAGDTEDDDDDVVSEEVATASVLLPEMVRLLSNAPKPAANTTSVVVVVVPAAATEGDDERLSVQITPAKRIRKAALHKYDA